MSNRPKGTCDQCRYYEQRIRPFSGEALPTGNCYGLPPDPDKDRTVADLRPACSLFEMRADEELNRPAGVADTLKLQRLCEDLD